VREGGPGGNVEPMAPAEDALARPLDLAPRPLRLVLDPPTLADGALDPAAIGWRPLEVALVSLGVLVFTFTGYYAVGLTTDPLKARSLETALDRAIPFVPWTIYLYAWVYTAMFYPVFVVRCPYLFRRVALAYVVTAAISMSCWIAWPVTSATIRPEIAPLGVAEFHLWGLRLNYALDPPTNLFPSLHLSVATLACLGAGTARRAAGFLLVPVVAIAVAITTVKQHFVADGVAGLLLGLTIWSLLIRPARVAGRPIEDVAHPLPYAAGYYVFHACVYGVMFVAYRNGLRVW
jgi:hypothetical protein